MSDTSNEYEGKTNAELSDELAARDLATSGNKQELIDRLEADDAEKASTGDAEKAPGDELADQGLDPAPPADDGALVGSDSVDSANASRPDADAVAATTQPDGTPDSGVPNPLPPDAATGDIVSQVRRGEVDGHVVDDAGDVRPTKPGDVLVSVDPVTFADGDALAKMRENAGSTHKPQRR